MAKCIDLGTVAIEYPLASRIAVDISSAILNFSPNIDIASVTIFSAGCCLVGMCAGNVLHINASNCLGAKCNSLGVGVIGNGLATIGLVAVIAVYGIGLAIVSSNDLAGERIDLVGGQRAALNNDSLVGLIEVTSNIAVYICVTNFAAIRAKKATNNALACLYIDIAICPEVALSIYVNEISSALCKCLILNTVDSGNMACLNFSIDHRILAISSSCNPLVLILVVCIGHFIESLNVFLICCLNVVLNHVRARARDENRLIAELANSIAPAGIGAGGLNSDKELVVVLNSSSTYRRNNIRNLAAISAVSYGQARLSAVSFLNNELCKVSAGFAFGLSKRNVLQVYYFTASGTNLCSDARRLCLNVHADFDSFPIIHRAGRCCHSSSRNQRCDHENSHQHAQQSLFHFLLFTSV